MKITYADLKASDNKLSVLLHRLSYPSQHDPAYWEHWIKQPLHEMVIRIVRTLGEFRQKIFRLEHEQEYIRNQSRALDQVRLVPEELMKLRKFLHRQYLGLLRAEKEELQKQLAFLQEQLVLINDEIAHEAEIEEQQWQTLFKEQLKVIMAELKKRNMMTELQELKQRFGG